LALLKVDALLESVPLLELKASSVSLASAEPKLVSPVGSLPELLYMCFPSERVSRSFVIGEEPTGESEAADPGSVRDS